MTNEEALDILERQIKCDNDNCPEPGMSCSECPYNVDAIDYARACKMAIEALDKQCASSEQDDHIADGSKMVKLQKRTIIERLIIAQSLIEGVIFDSSNQFRDETKMTEDVPDTNVGDMISRQDAIEVAKKHWYKPDIVGALAELPSVQPERKTGRWIDDNCSECGQYVFHGDVRNFCPNCGAMMMKEGEG